MKKSFVLYLDQYSSIKKLSDEQAGMLLKSMFEFHLGNDFEITDPVVDMAFSFLGETFKRDNAKYLEICEKNKANARMRWDKKNATASDRILEDAKNADSESDKIVIEDSESDKIVNNYKDSAERIITKLNKLAGKKFRFGSNNTKNIIARLKEKFTEEDCLKVLNTKIQDPHFIKNPQFLNPDTLFRPSNFEKYLNENPANYPKNDLMKKTGFTKDYYKPSSTGDKNEFF